MLTEREPRVVERNPRILANPFEFVVAIAFLIAGAGTVPKLVDYDAQPRIGLSALPVALLWAWVVSIMLGAVLTIIGLALSGRHVMVRATERAGLWLSLGTWASLTVVLVSINWHQWSAWGEYAAFSLGPALRLLAARRLERGLRRSVQRKDTA